MLRLTIEAVNIDELRQHIDELSGLIPKRRPLPSDGNEPATCADCPAPDQEYPAGTPVEGFRELSEVRGEISQAIEEAHDVMMGEATRDEPQGPTAEEVRSVLNELRKTKGTAAVKEILKAHGADNFPGLDKSQYAAVLKEAEANAAD